MNKQNKTLKNAMIEALEKSLGIVTTAAKLVGIERNTHYVWLKEDPEYKKAVDGISNMTIDFAESKLHSLIKNENPTAIIFYLKTKGRDRGYIESLNLGGDINIQIKEPDFSDD